MNIKQALKEKNRLKGKISEVSNKLNSYNVRVKEDQYYDPRELLNQLMTYHEQMITLKKKIQLANQEAHEKIARLAESKSLISKLQHIPTSSRMSQRDDGEYTRTMPVIGEIEKNDLILKLEKQIETIQDELDDFNHRTHI
jgi:hypothetical protein